MMNQDECRVGGTYAVGDRYGDSDAFVRGKPYREDDFDLPITVTLGEKAESTHWVPVTRPVGYLIAQYCRHPVGPKNGKAIVLAELIPGPRVNLAVVKITGIGLDIDNGTPVQEIEDAVKAEGVCAVRYSTHGHFKTTTKFVRDHVSSWFKSVGLDGQDFTDESMRRFCMERKGWHPCVANTVIFEAIDHETAGFMVAVSHAPISKNRVIFPLAESYVIEDVMNAGRLTQQEALRQWARYPEALAKKLGLTIDRACTDPCRLFYLPRHEVDRDYSISLFGGPLLKLSDLPVEAATSDTNGSSGKKSKTDAGKALGKWSRYRGVGFQIADVIEQFAPDKIRGRASQGFTVACPFGDSHGNAGDATDTGFYCANAADGANDWFIASCRHESCGGYTNLDFLGKMIGDGLFDQSVLWDEDFNCVELTEEEAAFGKPESDAEPEAELLPTLAELLAEVAILAKDAGPDVWRTMLVRIQASGLPPADQAVADQALKKQCGIAAKTYDAEVAAYKRAKKQQAKQRRRQGPNGPNEKTLSRSDALTTKLVATFGSRGFLLDPEFCGPLHLDYMEGKPWFMETYVDDQGDERIRRLCTPFMLDGVVKYPDRNNDEALRVRILKEDGTLAMVEFEAEKLGQYSGSDVTGKMFAKGWRGLEQGSKFALNVFKSQQLPGPTVYHRPGFRDGAFVLATGELIVPNGVQGNGAELHADTCLKGPFKSGTLDEWKRGAALLFGTPNFGDGLSPAWHFQCGVLLGYIGPILGYLGLNSMSAYIDGPSTRGKTTMQMLAGGNWATPDLKQDGFVRTASSTTNGLESSMERGSCAVLCYDEIARMSPQDQYNLIFMTEGATGKRRMDKGGGDKPTRQWTGLCVVTSAEVPLGQRLRIGNVQIAAGMTARVLPITVSGAKRLEGDDWKAVQTMLENYGHSGPDFCRALLSMDADKIRDRLAEVVDRVLGGDESPLRRRAAYNAAYIQIAAEVAQDAGLIPDTYDAAPLVRKLWEDFLASDIAPVDPAERAMKVLCHNLITRKGVDVIAFGELDKARGREAVAYHSASVKGMNGVYYVIPVNNLALLSGGGADPQALKALLDGSGYLVRKEDRMTWKRFPGLGEIGCVVLDAEKVDPKE